MGCVARFLCWVFGHQWRPSPNEEQYWYPSADKGDPQPWGVFTRCRRCHKPNPLWLCQWYPDTETGGE